MANAFTGAQFPSVSGAPIYGPTVVPDRFYSDFLYKYYRMCMYMGICNTDFTKDIEGFGDVLHVAQLPDMETFIYNQGMVIPTQTNFYKADVDLKINKARGWRVPMNPVFNKQTMHKDYWSRMAEDGAKQINIKIDNEILSVLPTQANASNIGAAAGAITGMWNLGASGAGLTIGPDDCVPYLLACEQVLWEQDILTTGKEDGERSGQDEEMYAVVPGWFHSYLMQAKVLQAWLSGDAKSPIRAYSCGHVGPVNIYRSNNLPYTAATKESPILFGVKRAVSFALQLQVAETKPHPTDIGDIMQAVTVYGYNAMISKGLGVGYVRPVNLIGGNIQS